MYKKLVSGILVLLGMHFMCKAQTFERQVFSTGSNDSTILSYNLGEAFVGYYSDACISLSMGQHPGDPNICNGLNEDALNAGFYLSPNPTQEYLFVNSQSTNFEIKIFTVSGELIYENKSIRKINVVHWPSGVYICALSFSNHQTHYNKFLKL